MNRLDVSRITCIADNRLTPRIEAEADRMGLLATYSERGKQVALKTRPAGLLFGRRPRLVEAPSDVIRLYVPRRHEQAAMARLAAAADLFLPGRGSLAGGSDPFGCQVENHGRGDARGHEAE